VTIDPFQKNWSSWLDADQPFFEVGARVPFGVKNETVAAANAELEPAIWFVAYYRRYQFATGCGDEIRAAAARSDAASE
jgi:hypothetical protein